MTIHVEEMTSDVTAAEGELPLSQAQIEKVVELVMSRLEEKQTETQHIQRATEIRAAAMPQY